MSTSIASGAVLLVVLQLSTRLVTFALNQALLRWTTPAAFGTASIQLEFLLNTVLFLSREGMRGAVLREKLPQDAQKLRSLHNSTWLPLLAGLPISFCITALYLWTAQSSTSSQPHFYAAVFLYIFSALLELASEPFFLDAQLRMDFKLRVSIEGSAVIVKSLLTLGSVVLRSQLGLLAFAIGQLGYSLTILVHYLVHQSSSIWPTASGHNSAIVNLAVALSKQSLIKQFLSEGDKMVVGRFATIEDQGGYAVALNYGSLLARCVFQPIEESSRIFFSRAANDKRDKTNAEKATRVLTALFHAYSLLALVLVCICPPYVPTLVRLLLGSRWSNTSAPAILRLYCYLLPFLGFNGILEAFVQSTVDQRQISRMNWWMGLWSFVYVAACIFFCQTLQLQSKGLIYANMVNMTCRVAWCFSYIQTWLHSRQLDVKSHSILPSRALLLVSGMAALLVRWSEPDRSAFKSAVHHIGVGVTAMLACIIVA